MKVAGHLIGSAQSARNGFPHQSGGAAGEVFGRRSGDCREGLFNIERAALTAHCAAMLRRRRNKMTLPTERRPSGVEASTWNERR